MSEDKIVFVGFFKQDLKELVKFLENTDYNPEHVKDLKEVLNNKVTSR